MEPILTVSHLQKVYGARGSRTQALTDLSFSVEEGEFTGIMGASGSGKTTLLNCVSTIDRPTGGAITVDGTDLTTLKGRALSRFRRERLGFIFQDCNLLDTLTGFENMALALTILGAAPKAVDRRVREAAGLLGLEGVLDKFPYQMSGWPPPGPSSPAPPWCWPTSPPAPWTPSPPGSSCGSFPPSIERRAPPF